MLKTKLLFPTIMLVCTLSNTIASVFIDVPIDELIRSSDLIIKGKVKSKYSQTESMIVEVGVKTGDKITTHKVDTRIPVTTYIIDSDEIIHGQHIKKEVVVKMQGGCGEDGLCLDDSSNYHYQVSDDVVIFLKYDHEYGQSSGQSRTCIE
ncbi:MAG: hypothetical protein KDI92_12730 [Xanthomonadales bacterium]|nr:hypothetical protein [Xanthomonadales bacterium]